MISAVEIWNSHVEYLKYQIGCSHVIGLLRSQRKLLILKPSEVYKNKAASWVISETKYHFHFQQWLQRGKVF